ncbi:MAG TPA: SIMPL domain-containing protein [Candidatus Elarobacter sp.]|jgi:uncharacterized protein YggE|nr:SIMPL domain-containing protein [Candidatus Elarobacter sp.]
MLKRGVVLGLVLLLPLAASAQVPIPPRAAAPSGGGGISVQGHGTVQFAVKDVQFTAFARGNADEASVIAAMRAAGVENPAVGSMSAQISRGSPTILRGTVRDVSQAKLEALGRAALAYATAHPGVAIDSINFSVPTAACAPHEEAARSAAIADARRRAQAIAALTGVTLEGVTGVYELGGCPPETDRSQGPPGPFDVMSLTSFVTVTEYVTFAIAPASGSMPRRPL